MVFRIVDFLEDCSLSKNDVVKKLKTNDKDHALFCAEMLKRTTIMFRATHRISGWLLTFLK